MPTVAAEGKTFSGGGGGDSEAPSGLLQPSLVLSCDTPLASHTEQKAILWPDPALRSYDD